MNEKKLLLIVEDQPIISLDYQLFFVNKNYRVITSFTGKSALDFKDTQTPDVALLDIRLKDDIYR
jgi:DNA-binding response OmpR family regulator